LDWEGTGIIEVGRESELLGLEGNRNYWVGKGIRMIGLGKKTQMITLEIEIIGLGRESK